MLLVSFLFGIWLLRQGGEIPRLVQATVVIGMTCRANDSQFPIKTQGEMLRHPPILLPKLVAGGGVAVVDEAGSRFRKSASSNGRVTVGFRWIPGLLWGT